jgi:hypothetical protein
MPVQRLKVAILPLDLPCSWAGNPFRGNFNHWQVLRKEAGQIFSLSLSLSLSPSLSLSLYIYIYILNIFLVEMLRTTV